MKIVKRVIRIPVIAIIAIAITAGSLSAKIDFDMLQDTKIDLSTLDIKKKDFFAFIRQVILDKPFGLGNYGRIPFHACDYKLKGRKLINYETMKGIGNEFLSNPSCDQSVIGRILEVNYGYQPDNLSSYQNRECILSVEEIFSPLLEYYSISLEEKPKKDCFRCDDQEKDRLSKIAKNQRKIKETCGDESSKVILFLKDLDQATEAAYKEKVSK